MLLLTLTSGCGVFHYVFYPPAECVCTPENSLAVQQLTGDEAAEFEQDGDPVHASHDDHSDDEHLDEEHLDDEGDENEIVADIPPGDLKSLGREETNDGVVNPRQRTLVRDSTEVSAEQTARLAQAHQGIDAVESNALVDLSSSAQRRAAEQKYGVTLPSGDNVRVMTGDFFHGEDNAAVVIPGNSIKIYSNGRLAAQRSLASQDATADLSELNADPALPVRLVQGGALQILVHSAETQPGGNAILYKIRIYKVIGTDIGVIFDETIARRDAADQPLQRLGSYEFLQGMNHRFIRWTSLDANEKPSAEPLILRWNRWEGVYRLPAPAPTSPKNQS